MPMHMTMEELQKLVGLEDAPPKEKAPAAPKAGKEEKHDQELLRVLETMTLTIEALVQAVAHQHRLIRGVLGLQIAWIVLLCVLALWHY